MSAVSIRIRTVIAEKSTMAVVIHSAPLVDADDDDMIVPEGVELAADSPEAVRGQSLALKRGRATAGSGLWVAGEQTNSVHMPGF